MFGMLLKFWACLVTMWMYQILSLVIHLAHFREFKCLVFCFISSSVWPALNDLWIKCSCLFSDIVTWPAWPTVTPTRTGTRTAGTTEVMTSIFSPLEDLQPICFIKTVCVCKSLQNIFISLKLSFLSSLLYTYSFWIPGSKLITIKLTSLGLVPIPVC